MTSSRPTPFARPICAWIVLCAFLWVEPGLALRLASAEEAVSETVQTAGTSDPSPAAERPELPEMASVTGTTSPLGSVSLTLRPIRPISTTPAQAPSRLVFGLGDNMQDDESSAPFYKKTWFLLAAAGAIVLTAVLVATVGDGESSEGGEPLPDFPPPPALAPLAHVQGGVR
jgi:hypothetical protein